MKLSEIANILNARFHGTDVEIDRVGSLETDYDNQILYVENGKNLDKVTAKKPAALIVAKGNYSGEIPFIEVDDPKLAFIILLKVFNPFENKPGIDPGAFADDTAELGENTVVMAGAVIMKGAFIGPGCVIYPNCVIEKDVVIGDRTILYPGVVVREGCIIGSDCVVHSGAVIGSDGFGFYQKNGDIIKIPQVGIVEIGNFVEIGANCTIDRATVYKTQIGDHTKLDNLVHIAHNVKIGEKCFIAAQAGISGSVVIGDRVIILGQVGIADHISIPDDTILMPQSGIPNDIRTSGAYFGTPARPVKEHHRINAALKYLPELLKRIKRLESRFDNGDDKK